MNIQELIRSHYERWIEAEKFGMPDLDDALMFMVTETGEAIDARMRTKQQYSRNNDPQTQWFDESIGAELFDVIMMACISMDILGVDLEEVAKKKLAWMDMKRGL